MTTPTRPTEPREFRSIEEFRNAFFPDHQDRDRSPSPPGPVNSKWPQGADLADTMLEELRTALPK